MQMKFSSSLQKKSLLGCDLALGSSVASLLMHDVLVKRELWPRNQPATSGCLAYVSQKFRERTINGRGELSRGLPGRRIATSPPGLVSL